MSDHTIYRINAPQVIGEVIDDEAIIVNLDSGAYYSLRGSGARTWELLTTGATLGYIVDALVAEYPAASEAVQPAVAALLAELEAEQLVSHSTQTDGSAPPPGPAQSSRAGQPFVAPVLEKFTDMADLLLLDPIHDVDAAGWPQPKQG